MNLALPISRTVQAICQRLLQPTAHFRGQSLSIDVSGQDSMPDHYDTSAREQRLLERLQVSPVMDVLGVAAPSGVGGGRGSGETLWTLSLTFDAWRIGGGHLRTSPLRISRKITEQELAELRSMIEPYAVVRIKARVAESALGDHQALLEDFVGVENSDTELNHHAEELQKPVSFKDPILGTFTLDRRVDWFTAELVWDGTPVSFNLSESAKVQEALAVARELWQHQSEWNRRVRDYAVRELLPVKNENWLEDDESELTTEEFQGRMTLEAITVHPGGFFEFWHDDGDLFWGHAIHISGSLSEGLTHADIPG